LRNLLDHASRRASTEHDHSTVCRILENDLDTPVSGELSDSRVQSKRARSARLCPQSN
jgi:hypothetical protein